MRKTLLCAAAAMAALSQAVGAAGAAGPFTLSSPTFADNALMDEAQAGALPGNPNCIGRNVSPALRWSNVPAGTRSVAILITDPDGRMGQGVIHWVAYGIRPELGGFKEGAVSAPSADYVGGKGTAGLGHYVGPCPPPNQTVHHYSFVAIATDFAPEALPPGLTRDEFMAKLGGHALAASGIVGRFQFIRSR